MIRKQIYLTPQLDRELNIRARSEGKSVAEVIRHLLDEKLDLTREKRSGASVLLRMSERAFKGPKDLSTNMFDYLYGDKSPNYGKNAPKLTKKELEHIDKFLNEHSKNTD